MLKKELGLLMLLSTILLSGCGGDKPATVTKGTGDLPSKQVITQPEQNKDRSGDCTVDRISLDSETAQNFYGTWKVEKLLGFANSYNDASEYPTGQKIIGDKVIIEKDFFSSKGLKNYKNYQYELKNPLYQNTATCYNSTSFYRLYKIQIPDLNENDEVQAIDISDPSTKMSIPVSLSFLAVNDDRLILLSEATIFELKKITD
ncbi:hypothetical protein MKY96_27470 [Paenibacillus sp. FSL R7-0302]|uniref:hypothetical protein n=1 Tax=Paenibacillus sp. FSL R7-0302 TaxID=2921681 RepID=UPI0030FA6719